jgi:hypothetical protein
LCPRPASPCVSSQENAEWLTTKYGDPPTNPFGQSGFVIIDAKAGPLVIWPARGFSFKFVGSECYRHVKSVQQLVEMAAPPRRVWCRNTVCPSLDIQPYTADSPFNTFHRHIRMFGSKYTIRVHWLLFPAIMRERFPIIQTPCPDARSRSSWAYKRCNYHGSHSLRFAILFGGAKGARDGDDEGQRKLTTPANLANPWSHAGQSSLDERLFLWKLRSATANILCAYRRTLQAPSRWSARCSSAHPQGWLQLAPEQCQRQLGVAPVYPRGWRAMGSNLLPTLTFSQR